MTLLHQAAQKAVEALQLAHAGLEWYRDRFSEVVDGSDEEADEKIGDALAALESSLQQQPEPVALSDGRRFYEALRRADPIEFPDEWDDMTPTWHERMESAARTYTPPALQHQEVPREPEPVGTFACSVCGVAEPHHHDIAYINKRRVEEAVLRPRFEQLLHNLMQGGEPFSELRVSGWGNPIFWNKRWPTPSIEMPAAYRDMKAEALWQFFLRAHYAASPSTTRQQEVGSDDEWKQEAATVLARFIHLSAQPVVEEWAQTASAAIRLLNDPAGLAAAPSTPEKAGGVSDAGVMASADGWVQAGLVCQACAGDAPGGKCRNPKCVGGPIVRELVPAEKDEPSPIPHPLPAQANDGGEHG